jgi:hypothetical protein
MERQTTLRCVHAHHLALMNTPFWVGLLVWRLLQVMKMETGPLTHYHAAAAKASAYTPSPRSVGSASPYASPRNEYQVHAGSGSKASTWKAKGKALLGPLQAGLTGSSGAGDAAAAGAGGEGGTYSVQGTGVSSASMRGVAAAGGYSLGRRSVEELLLDEQVLLRVLCHRCAGGRGMMGGGCGYMWGLLLEQCSRGQPPAAPRHPMEHCKPAAQLYLPGICPSPALLPRCSAPSPLVHPGLRHTIRYFDLGCIVFLLCLPPSPPPQCPPGRTTRPAST